MLTAPNICHISHVNEIRQVFNSRLHVYETETKEGPLEKISIDYSAKKIRGTVWRRARSRSYSFNTETQAYDENGPLEHEVHWSDWNKIVVHFTFDDVGSILEIRP